MSVATDDHRIVSVISQLAPCVLNDEEAHEFSFEIGIFSMDDGQEPLRTMDLPDEVRGHIMPIVCKCVNRLIQKEKPNLITW